MKRWMHRHPNASMVASFLLVLLALSNLRRGGQEWWETALSIITLFYGSFWCVWWYDQTGGDQ